MPSEKFRILLRAKPIIMMNRPVFYAVNSIGEVIHQMLFIAHALEHRLHYGIFVQFKVRVDITGLHNPV